MDLARELRRTWGVASGRYLRSLGASPSALRHAARTGRLLQPRRGWYALPDAEAPLLRAVGVGGRLGCVSAAELMGLWAPGSARLHVAVPKHAGRIQLGDPDIHVHWRSARWRDNPFALESVPDVLRQVAACCEREDAVAVLDSALHRSAASWSTVRSALTGLPGGASLLGSIDGRSESGPESLCRFRLRVLGLPVQPQSEIAGVGRVDLLVGTRLVLEIDGKRWHDDPDAFERDRARDLELARRGYRVIRLTYLQVMFGWAEAEAAIIALVSRGEHR